jgi:ribonuclease BN (tRNA processing enzyme)
MPILHEVPCAECEIGEFKVTTALVNHPGPTVGYRISAHSAVIAYLPDHEPALGVNHFPLSTDWTSGYALAARADLLIHDTQYTSEEYYDRVGWGHSSVLHSFAFASLCEARHLVTFHHDPEHSDGDLEKLTNRALENIHPACTVTIGAEGDTFQLNGN